MSTYRPEVSPGEAEAFFHAGIEQLGHVLLEERAAKEAVILNAVVGGNIVLIGDPGGGKTTLAEAVPLLFRGIEEDDIAIIPAIADLTPQQLVGSRAQIRKDTRSGGKSASEIISTGSEPIIKPTTRVLYGNEINRAPAHTRGALLDVWEERRLRAPGVNVPLTFLEFGIDTQNVGDITTGVFKGLPAEASRKQMGAHLDVESERRKQAAELEILRGWVSRPDRIHTVATIRGLHRLRRSAAATALPETLEGRALTLVRHTAEVLADIEHGPSIRESRKRMTKQVSRLSRADAFLRGQDGVKEVNLNHAVRYILTARLGTLSPNAYDEIPGAYAAAIR